MNVRTKLASGLAAMVLTAGALFGCSAVTATSPTSTSTTWVASVDGSLSAAKVLAEDQASHADRDAATYDEASVINIELDQTSASSDSDKVTVDGGTVTITAGGTYRISGELTGGQIVVDAADQTVKLILDDASITSSTSAAIAVTAAEEAVVILADGSTNTLSDTSTYADDADVNAALFSDADLTITGTGALTVAGNGNDGIVSKDGLVIESGAITVSAADDGIRGKDYVIIEGGTIAVTSDGDGLKADNSEDTDRGYLQIADGTITVTSGGDALDAATDLVITGGDLTVQSGGGSTVAPADDTSAKGLKSGMITVVEGGTVKINSSDDGVHSDGAVHLNGGTLTVASGDDGVHAEGTLQIDNGTATVTEATEGLEGSDIVVNGGTTEVTTSDDGVNASGGTAATSGSGGGGGEEVLDVSVTVTGGSLIINSEGDGLDSNGVASITGGTVVVNGPEQNGNGALDVNGDLTVSGGTLVAAGSAGMAVSPATESGQGWVSSSLDSAVAAGTTVQLVDADGTVLVSFVTSKSAQNFVFSSSAITTGEEYSVYVGGEASGADIGGLREAGTAGSGTSAATVTAGEAAAGGMGGGGGGQGRGGRG